MINPLAKIAGSESLQILLCDFVYGSVVCQRPEAGCSKRVPEGRTECRFSRQGGADGVDGLDVRVAMSIEGPLSLDP